MDLIKNNPYRTVGLLIGATAKEQEKQVRKLKQYLDAEQEPQVDFSFPVLGSLNRTVKKVEDATSRLNLDSDRLHYALFWFYSGNSITDEPAFEALRDSDIQSTIDIWSKLISSGEVTQRNSSAFHNLSTLLLWKSYEGLSISHPYFEQALDLKLRFLESDFVKELKTKSTDETFTITKNEIQLTFLNAVHLEIERLGGISVGNFVKILSKANFSAKEEFLKGYVQKPIDQIEKRVEETKHKRKANNANAANTGVEFFNTVNDELNLLKSILGISSLKYSSIADKVADEILQCGIDYFTYYRDSSTDPSNRSIEVFNLAKMLAVGNIVRQRIQENTQSLQEWIDEKPERERQKKIFADFEKLKNFIDENETKKQTAANAKQLLVNSRPYLTNIKNVLGASDNLYLGISTRIASDAQGMCVSEVNALQKFIGSAFEHSIKMGAIMMLKECVNLSWEVTNLIGSMDLIADFRDHYNNNRATLSGLRNQMTSINPIAMNTRPVISSNYRKPTSSSSGCYIATMAYGDYNHPQVIILRNFRDETLTRTKLGRLFIKSYYKISPKLVELLKKQERTNKLIRIILNQLIKMIKR
ncbi:hypothetical protein HXX01_02675 [Candidatus Nomurabacteria bacterium]|nr:hypothetical protein [Candidatus Nomurabacteria bacterium]